MKFVLIALALLASMTLMGCASSTESAGPWDVPPPPVYWHHHHHHFPVPPPRPDFNHHHWDHHH